MRLAEWFDVPNPDGSRKSKAAFAERIGVTPQMISAYCQLKMWPAKERWDAIIRETDGQVTPNDHIGMQGVA